MASYGRYTQVDLGDLSFLDQGAMARPVLSREAARFALELSAVAYDFEVDRWLGAGWTDISIQADERLLGGVRAPEESGKPLRQRLLNEYLAYSARRHIASNHIIRKVMGLIWQDDEPLETGKAITMIHPLPEGRFALAIGFMGTGKRMIDWAANFRLGHEEGFHEGFLALTRQYEANAEHLTFDQTALTLGLERLSLQDIILEAARPDSRFLLFASGHSQGAAVLQLWMHSLISQGLLRQNILGYGFASPSVCALEQDGLADYPLFHLINSDDIVPRVGLFHHIGRRCLFPSDDMMRDFCYQGRQTDSLFMETLALAGSFRGTEDTLRFCISFVGALRALPPQEAAAGLAAFVGKGLRERLLLNQEEPVGGLLRLMDRTLRGYYARAMGRQAEEEEVLRLAPELEMLMRTHGAEAFTRTCLSVMSVPHRLVFRDHDLPGLAPYSYMVIRAFSQLEEID